jgi:hypothetical protein
MTLLSFYARSAHVGSRREHRHHHWCLYTVPPQTSHRNPLQEGPRIFESHQLKRSRYPNSQENNISRGSVRKPQDSETGSQNSDDTRDVSIPWRQ